MSATMTTSTTHEPTPEERSGWGFILRRLLDDGASLDEVLLDEESREKALGRMLAVAIAGLMLFGLAVGFTAEVAGIGKGTQSIWIPVSFTGGFLTAIAVGLPSFYFYTQLAGVDASFRLVTAQAVRVQARTSVLLMGALPFYAAVALASITDLRLIDVFMTDFLFMSIFDDPSEACIGIGIAIPYVVGLFGLRSVYKSFGRMLDVLPVTHTRRGDVLIRMLLLWGVLAMTVAPVAMYRIAEWLSAVT